MSKERKLRKTPSLQRVIDRISPKVVIWVVCEGKTEPNYIKEFALDHGNGKVKIEAVPEAGVPLTLVQEATKLKNKLTDIANDDSADSFEQAFSVWTICDRDEHPNIQRARDLADLNKIPFCMSNPCFELWGILHIVDQDADIHRHALQSKLKGLMPGYDHNKGATFNYEAIKDNYNTAKNRAVNINQRRIEEDNPQGNTSTDVFLLLDKIIENGRK